MAIQNSVAVAMTAFLESSMNGARPPSSVTLPFGPYVDVENIDTAGDNKVGCEAPALLGLFAPYAGDTGSLACTVGLAWRGAGGLGRGHRARTEGPSRARLFSAKRHGRQVGVRYYQGLADRGERSVMRNLIFDLGGTVLEWNPDAILRNYYADPDARAAMKTALCQHPDWLQMDRGTLTEAEALARLEARTRLFRGIVISGEIKMIKSEREIFEYLLRRYDLLPTETVFIDDHQPNIQTAQALGLHTIWFRDAWQCELELEHLLLAE